jgi:hypothetical protein
MVLILIAILFPVCLAFVRLDLETLRDECVA